MISSSPNKIILVTLGTILLIITTSLFFLLNLNQSSILKFIPFFSKTPKFKTQSNIPEIKKFNINDDEIKQDIEEIGIKELAYQNPNNTQSIINISEIIFKLTTDSSKINYFLKGNNKETLVGYHLNSNQGETVIINIYLPPKSLDSKDQATINRHIYWAVLSAMEKLSVDHASDLEPKFIHLITKKVQDNTLPITISYY